MTEQNGYLDTFERMLEAGLVKLCSQAGLLDSMTLMSPDISDKWNDDYLKDYMADAVVQFNESPEVAMAWAAYLGMGVAHHWDEDWEAWSGVPYRDYYGPHGWDDMDDHIADDILSLDADVKGRIVQALQSCAAATLSLLHHEGIQTDTETGFYVLVRIYTVFFTLGASIELKRLGYHREPILTAKC